MADKIIGSLIYGDHPIPKKSKALKERLKVPVAIALVLIFISGIIYKFANFREERRVRQFMETVQRGQMETAYGQWDAGGRYTLKDFLADWERKDITQRDARRPRRRFQFAGKLSDRVCRHRLA
jgi:hypothetical protein